jgi:hypothetical protein
MRRAPLLLLLASPAVTPLLLVSPGAAAPQADIRHIGMHIGGGPNDDATKEPFWRSIAARHQDFAACWSKLPKAAKVEFGIDALVPGKGGRAQVDGPRSTVKDDAFVACMRDVYATMDFLPPKSGIPTKVSASIRLSPRP